MAEAISHRGTITVCVMLATIMQALDTTIANVALPYMMGSLSATLDQINWVLTSYIVAAAITMPLTGFVVARFGRKPIFIAAVIGFMIVRSPRALLTRTIASSAASGTHMSDGCVAMQRSLTPSTAWIRL